MAVMPKRDDKEQFVKNHPNVVAREMPNSYEAETALLGGMLIDGSVASGYMSRLSSDDFYTPAHKYIYEAMRELSVAAQAIDLVTVVGQLEKFGTLGMCGGVEYLTKIIAAVPSVANSGYYFDIVKKDTRLRSIINIATRMADEAYALDPDDGALTRAEAMLYGLSESTQRGKPQDIRPYLGNVLTDLSQRATESVYRGVPTGFTKLDGKLGGGFQKGDLIILAARPGQGKTSFAMNCAVNAARRFRPDDKKPFSVAVFSLEMSAMQLAKRMLCSVGNYDMSRVNRAAVFDKEDWDKLYAAKAALADANLLVDESGDITPAEILSKCRAIKHSGGGLDFVMIDYLQLMQSGKKLDNFVREIAEITRALKLAAKELQVPILLLSQMSRSIEQRKGNDKESRLSDLRDSGAIEQDADIVLFIDRKEKQGDDKADSDVYLNIAKHRNGETGHVKLVWNPSTTTFSDPDASNRPEDPYAPRAKKVTKSAAPSSNNGATVPDASEEPYDDYNSAVDSGLVD